jgi:hypothetical protein
MALAPIDFSIVSVPIPNTTRVDLAVSAKTNLFQQVSGSASFNTINIHPSNLATLGTTSYFSSIISTTGSVLSHVQGSTLLASSTAGILVGTNKPSAYQPFTLFSVAYVPGTPASTVIADVKSGSYPMGSEVRSQILETSTISNVSNSGIISVSSLIPGTSYDFYVIVYDAVNDFLDYITFPITTTQDISITSFSSKDVGITIAKSSMISFDPDSSNIVRTAIVDANVRLATYGNILVNAPLTVNDPMFEFILDPSPTPIITTLQFSNLTPNKLYKQITASIDSVTSNVTLVETQPFKMFNEWIVDEILFTNIGYYDVTSKVDVLGDFGDATVYVSTLPNTPSNISKWYSANIYDPLSNVSVFSLSNGVAKSFAYSSSNLLDFEGYVIATKIVSINEPWMYSYKIQPFVTVDKPEASIVLTNPSLLGGPRFYFSAEAIVDIQANYPLNVYTAIVPAVVPDDVAYSNLLLYGSAAYPDAFVDQNEPPPFSGYAKRKGLKAGTSYKAVTVATFPFDLSIKFGSSLAIDTVPLPTLTITQNFITDTAVQVKLKANSDIVFNSYIYLTPNLVAGQPQYDSLDIINNSIPGVQLFLGQSNYDVIATFSNLLEDTMYGIVGVASDNSNVLVVKEFTTKTGSNPVINIQVINITPRQVDYRVFVNDKDSTFDLFTAVSLVPFIGTDAQNLALNGLSYSNNNVVPGTITVFPNDLLLKSSSIDFSACNLSQDTIYSIIAAAKDEVTEIVILQQFPFITDFVPLISILNVTPYTRRVVFDLSIQDRDGPSVTIFWKAYPSAMGLTSDLVMTDTGVDTIIDFGTGSRTLLALEYDDLQPGSKYYLAAVITTLAGNSTLITHEFDTFSPPEITISNTVYSTEIYVSLVAKDPDIEPFNTYLALFDSNIPIVNSNLITGIVDSTAQYIDRIAFNGTLAFSNIHRFNLLDQGTDYTTIAVVEDIHSGELAFATSVDTTRVQPDILSFISNIKRKSVVANFSATFTDPVPSRSNYVEFAATVVPSGAPFHWLVPGISNSYDSNIPISEGIVSSITSNYATPEILTKYNSYDFVIRAIDHLDNSNIHTLTTHFSTRSDIDISFSQQSVSPSNVIYTFTSTVIDGGTMELRGRVFPNLTSSSIPTQNEIDITASAGTIFRSGTSFETGTIEFAPLTGNFPYLAVFVAVDEASGESNYDYDTFITSSVPPSIKFNPITVIRTSTGLTATILASDIDSGFKVFTTHVPAGTIIDSTIINFVIAAEPNKKEFFFPAIGPTPFAITLTGLTPMTQYRLLTVAVDTLGNHAYDICDVATLQISNFIDKTEYDGSYILKWRHDATYSKLVTGATIGNGKIAMIANSPDMIGNESYGFDSVIIGGTYEYNEFGGYTNNVADAFNAFQTSFFYHSMNPVQPVYTMEIQELNMKTSMLTSKGKVVDAVTSHIVDFEYDVYTLQNNAFSCVKTIRITPSANMDLEWFHEISAPSSLKNSYFVSSSINSPLLGSAVHLFESKADIRGSKGSIACSTVYLFENPLSVIHKGFNKFRNSDRAFNEFNFNSLISGTTYRIHILVTQGTSFDFQDPEDAVRRLSLSIRGQEAANIAASRIRTNHVLTMSKAWESGISLDPKLTASAQEQIEQIEIQRAIRYAQYNLMTVVRDGSLTDLNPSNASVVDKDGSLMWGSEMYLIPYLLYTQNKSVRKLLETSYKGLEKAKAVAEGLGYAGALFPYVNPNIDYNSHTFWDVTNSQYVFKTALVGICTWDYFRVTLDRSWLIQKGYAILAGVADMISSKAIINANGRASITYVIDLNGKVVDNDAFTIYSCRVALKAAIEASYELSYLVPEEWETVFHGLKTEHFTGANFEIIKPNDSFGISDTMEVLHPLLILQEHYSTEFLRTVVTNTNNEKTLHENVLFYSTATTPSFTLDPQNILLVSGIHGVLARSTSANANIFDAYVKSFLKEAENDIWGGFSKSPVSNISVRNSPSLSAQFLTNIISNLCGLNVAGGTTQSGFRYEHYGIFGRFSTNLPSAISKITIPNVGRGKQTFVIINEQ